jgi:hypothetical protein
MQTPNELSPAEFWENRYRTADVAAVSWYEPVPHLSLALLELGGSQPNESVIDIGGGASFLAQSLNERGYSDVSVLDASNEALEIARSRWTESSNINWLATDLLTWTHERTWNAWHHRAVFQFVSEARSNQRIRLWQAYSLSLAKFGGAGKALDWLNQLPPRDDGQVLRLARANFAEQLRNWKETIEQLQPLADKGQLPPKDWQRLANAYVQQVDEKGLEKLLQSAPSPEVANQTRLAMANLAADNLLAFFGNGSALTPLNPEVLQKP